MVGFALVKWLIISAILWSTSPLTFTKLLQGSQNSKPCLTSKWTNYQGEPTIGWDDALSALLIGCCCAASIIWISFPPIWFTMILSILHYLVQVLQKMVKFSYSLHPIAIFPRTTSQSFFFDYILYVALKTLICLSIGPCCTECLAWSTHAIILKVPKTSCRKTLELTRPKTVPGGAVKCPNHLVNQIDIADLNWKIKSELIVKFI